MCDAARTSARGDATIADSAMRSDSEWSPNVPMANTLLHQALRGRTLSRPQAEARSNDERHIDRIVRAVTVGVAIVALTLIVWSLMQLSAIDQPFRLRG